VHLIGPYTLRGKDRTEIDFMCLTLIDPASSWFEIVELPVTTDPAIPIDPKGQRDTKTHNNNKTKLPYFDKSSAMISNLVNMTWFNCYPCCQYIAYENVSIFEALCESNGIKHKPTSIKNPQANAILERYIKLLLRCSTLLK